MQTNENTEKKLLDLKFLIHKEHRTNRDSHSEMFYRNGRLLKNLS